MNETTPCSLLSLPAGKRVKIQRLQGDGPTRSRLCALGFTPGTVVEICPECGGAGGRRVRMRGAALVLDAAVAECVMCDAAHIDAGQNNLPCCEDLAAKYCPFEQNK